VLLDPDRITIVRISEASASDEGQGYYDGDDSVFARTTIEAFRDAGAAVSSIEDILSLGVYLTNAVKCAKTGYRIATSTVNQCSKLLEQELARFPNTRAYLLMGDVAIKAVNAIARRRGGGRAIPAGSTYKIRGGEFHLDGIRLFPSYVQAGPAFFIEKSKRRMIAEDIAAALHLTAAG
jgi:uracil-DNA glycosylase